MSTIPNFLREPEWHVDIVMCLDATGSMHHVIDKVCDNALCLHQKLKDFMFEHDRELKGLRLKVILFRDYGIDAEPMVETEFFNITDGEDDQSGDFHDFICNVRAGGGGDRPENALEALTFALRSDWTRLGTHRRHIVLLCTDAPALPLGARSDSDCYPADMPKDLEELSKIWEEDMDRRAKRIFLYAPYEEPWDMLEMWTQCFHCDMDSYDKFDFDECLRMMSFS